MLVGEWREGDGRETAALKPVHGGGVDGHSLLGRDIGPVLQVVVLPLLLGLEVESCQPAEVLFADRLVDGGAATDPLAVVVRSVGPPVRLGLDIAEDHVLNRNWEPWNLNMGIKHKTQCYNVYKLLFPYQQHYRYVYYAHIDQWWYYRF